MLKQLFRPNPRRRAVQPPRPGLFPILPADALLEPHGPILNRIEELAGVPRSYYQRYYQAALQQYARFVQQLPASEAHHHAGPGGLLAHGLAVAAAALKIRRGHLLPPGASAETIDQQQDLWTYAVFTAALCHDLGKPAADQAVTLYDDQGNAWPWSPWTGHMAAPAKWYGNEFRRGRVYGLHEKAALLLVNRIVPPEGLAWLSGEVGAFAAWLACVAGDTDNAGPFGEIVGRADGESVSRSLGAEPRNRLPASRIWRDPDRRPARFAGAVIPQEAVARPVQEEPGREAAWQGVDTSDETLNPMTAHPAPDGALSMEDLLPGALGEALAGSDPTEGDAAEGKAPCRQPDTRTPSDTDDLGARFLAWVRENVHNGALPVNTPEALVHVVSEGVLLVSPALFKTYIEQTGIEASW
ncbi:MAG: TraI domain-containing protein, partial [Rhodobacteraceae bacterium]|nr:TraI domain-containing protein [Paracoccaceae bacterium]